VNNKYEIMAEHHKELDYWLEASPDCDKALFWAGRMAQTIKAMTVCSPIQLSAYIELCDLMRQEYDQIIFSRTK
jgi:predicted nucleotide-binding protein (sugar kinase/HSP70/actin superfamily)